MLGSGAELQHVDQTRQAASATPKEIARQDLNGSGAILDIDSQTLTQEDFQVAAELVRMLQRWRAVGGDQEKGLERFFIQIWRLGLDHLDGHDAERPHVDFAAVLLLLDDFRGHPVRCANHGRSLGFLVGEFGAEAKVG